MTGWVVPILLAAAQSSTMTQGPHRMEIVLERMDGGSWKAIDPALVLQQGDRVRFRFRTNFDGYLYVTNLNTSGRHEVLFPREDTGQDNRVAADREYLVPATSAAFKIAGPAGHEVVYWLVSPLPLGTVPPGRREKPLTLMPRCDDSVLRARGISFSPAEWSMQSPRGEGQRDLLVVQKQDTAVVSSPVPLTGPVVYEFHLAHR